MVVKGREGERRGQMMMEKQIGGKKMDECCRARRGKARAIYIGGAQELKKKD